MNSIAATHKPKRTGTTCIAQHKRCQLILYLYAKTHTNTIPTNSAHAASLRFSSVHCALQDFASCRTLDTTESYLRKHSQETTDCQNKRFCSAEQSSRFIVHVILTVIALEMLQQCFVIFFSETPLYIYRETQNHWPCYLHLFI